MSKSNVLFILTGSIACFKACELISRLVKNGHKVKCVATPSALKFIGTATLEGLTGQPVATDTFEEGHMMDHIHLARNADMVIACPTTAKSINNWAYGTGGDLASSLFLAFDRPQDFYIVPAMNSKMYEHQTTQNSLKKLQGFGYQVLSTQTGELACGEYGSGRMLEVDSIYNFIFKPQTKKKVLITAGGTSEPIDGVRHITNTSTGNTALKLAQSLQAQGFEVTYLRAKTAQKLNMAKNYEFTSFKSLESQLFDLLKNEKFDYIYHAAAVSDYSVSFINSQPTNESIKISSDEEQIDLTLTKNPKLIQSLKALSPHSTVVGFKLTKTVLDSERQEAVKKLCPYVDYIVHNDMLEIEAGQHQFNLYNNRLEALAQSVKSITDVPFFIKPLNQENTHDLMS